MYFLRYLVEDVWRQSGDSCSRLKRPKKNSSTLEDGPLCCQEKSETKQPMTQRHVPDELKSQYVRQIMQYYRMVPIQKGLLSDREPTN